MPSHTIRNNTFFLEGGKFPLISKFWQTLVFVSVKDKGRSFDDNTLNQFPNTNSSSDARLWFWVNVKVTCYVIWQSLKVSTVLPTVCIKSRWKFQQSYQQCVYRVAESFNSLTNSVCTEFVWLELLVCSHVDVSCVACSLAANTQTTLMALSLLKH